MGDVGLTNSTIPFFVRRLVGRNVSSEEGRLVLGLGCFCDGASRNCPGSGFRDMNSGEALAGF